MVCVVPGVKNAPIVAVEFDEVGAPGLINWVTAAVAYPVASTAEF